MLEKERSPLFKRQEKSLLDKLTFLVVKVELERLAAEPVRVERLLAPVKLHLFQRP
jgi:hypothetical protein